MSLARALSGRGHGTGLPARRAGGEVTIASMRATAERRRYIRVSSVRVAGRAGAGVIVRCTMTLPRIQHARQETEVKRRNAW